jgi:hypothetical protein
VELTLQRDEAADPQPAQSHLSFVGP